MTDRSQERWDKDGRVHIKLSAFLLKEGKETRVSTVGPGQPPLVSLVLRQGLKGSLPDGIFSAGCHRECNELMHRIFGLSEV